MGMYYEDFREQMRQLVQEKLGDEAEVFFRIREKNNQTLKDGLCIRKCSGKEGIAVYPEELYRQYMAGATPERLAANVAGLFHMSKKIPGTDILMDWEKVKGRLQLRLVKKAWNEENLKNRVYREYLDFAVMVAVELFGRLDNVSRTIANSAANGAGHTCSTLVEPFMMNTWGVSEDELYRTAFRNLYQEEFEIIRLSALLPPDGGDCGQEELYFFGCMKRSFRASAIFREDLLNRFAEEQGRNLFILPCSVHELLLLKQEEGVDVQNLKEIVREVNDESGDIKQEEKLSDSIYYYARESRRVELAL